MFVQMSSAPPPMPDVHTDLQCLREWYTMEGRTSDAVLFHLYGMSVRSPLSLRDDGPHAVCVASVE